MMTTRVRSICGGAVTALALGMTLCGCAGDGGGAPVTPENSIVAKPPEQRSPGGPSGGAPMPGQAPGQPGAVGPGAPGGAGGR